MDVMTLAAKLTLNTSEFDTGLDTSEKKMSGMTKGAVALGNLTSQVITASARAVKNFAKDAFETSMSFDERMSEVKAIAGATEEQYEALREKAKQTGESTKFTAEEAASALKYMGMAGWKTEQMLAGLDGVINLAAASGEDLGTVSDIVTDALTAFGLQASDSTHFANLLATAAMNANTNVGMMGQSFKYIAPVAGAFGISAEDIAESLGLMANQGIKASQAGTSMRRIFTNLGTDLNHVNTAAFEEFGINFFNTEVDPEALREYESFYNEINKGNQALQKYIAETSDVVDAEGNVLSQYLDQNGKVLPEYEEAVETVLSTREALIDAFWNDESNSKLKSQLDDLWDTVYKNMDVKDWSDYVDSWRKVWNSGEMTQEQQINWAKKIAGQNGFSSWIALMNATDEEIQRIRSAIEATDEGAGAAQEMADIMLNNLQGDITILQSALDGLKILISDEYKDKVRDFIKMMTEEIGKLGEAFKEGGLTGMFSTLATDLFGGLADFITANPDKIVGVVTSIIDVIAQATPKIVSALIQVLSSPELWQALGEGFKKIWQTIFGTPEGNLNENLFGDFQEGTEKNITAFEQLESYIQAYNEYQRLVNKAQDLFLNGAGENDTEMQDINRQLDETERLYKSFEDALQHTENGKNLFSQYMAWAHEHGFNSAAGGELPEVPVELKPDPSQIEAELNGGYSATVTLIPDASNMPNATSDGSHAKGLWTVPYDDYTATLHRGEMVLTKSQARKYKQGGSETDYDAIGSMIGSAINQAMSKVYVMMSGEKVGDLTTKRVKNNINADSYSRLRALGG